MANGPVVLLSGASSGIGAALAVELARSCGARLGLLARRAELVEEVGRQVEAAGGEALALPADVTDPAAVAEAARLLVERWGPVDIAIANAGVGDPMPMARFSAERAAWLMRVNWEGAMNVFGAVLPSMWERRAGQIVGVSSIAGARGLPQSGPYCASKAALSTMLEAMRLELAPRGVAVTAVHPGYVTTPMTAKNRFPMPFIWPVEKAARVMAQGIIRRRREVNFPLPMFLATRLLRWLPDWIYDLLLRRRSRA
jgi:NAD(P)-dependent dehydrogenase (short-subunit alcohol dehydrogenase family)